MEENWCKKCGKRSIDKSDTPHSVLCKECREEYLKLNIPKPLAVTTMLVLLLIVVTFAFSLKGFQCYGAYSSAERIARKGYVATSLNNLATILEEKPDNKYVAMKIVKISMKYCCWDYATYALQNYLDNMSLTDSEYNNIMNYANQLNIYYDTMQFAGDAFDEATENSQSEDEQLSIYQDKLSEENSAITEAWSDLASCYRRIGEFASAREILKTQYKINRENTSLLRVYATLELVEGNMETGLDYATEAYNLNPEGDYVADTYLVALYVNGFEE